MSLINSIQDKNHILGVYSSQEQKIKKGLEYLQIGCEQKNEAILIITNESSKDKFRNAITSNWNIFPDELIKIEKSGTIIIKSSYEFYFPTGISNSEPLIIQYSSISNKAIENGKSGLRIFADVGVFFELGYEDDLIEFESLASSSFDFPLTCICAYDSTDIQGLSLTKRKLIFDHHHHHLINHFYQNLIVNPTPFLTEHIGMFFYNIEMGELPPEEFKESILAYLVEGLQNDQLCIYHSINNIKKGHPEKVIRQISNLINYKEKNLMIIANSDHYYVSAACDNLQPFEDLKKQITQKAIAENKKEIRIVTDYANILYKNKHFDQCVALEEWKRKNKLNVSILCIFHNNNFDRIPYKNHTYRIINYHGIVCDAKGEVFHTNS
jgi:hypothetical protein